ncbi:MAG: patatin-like phospholipase family protein [Gammaproteobacteria bacterium]|nr:patatin-like phospholipase family protein [Gammaproteobacteria bacterium]MDH5176543.1 patatin-like phospholipase family protein [Gammaproteobacteria bacterium]MDH5227686.1 patatin-like phospholipase family protein [Gammaproteobacteria bacterium]
MNSAARATLVTALQQYFSIPQPEAALVLDEFEPCVCHGGDWLFRQGDPADCLYLLARGRMQVWLEQANAAEPGERLVAEVNPGETIGEIGMLTGDARSASIRAVRNSLLLKLTSAAFDRLSRQRPELTRHIAGGIAGRLRDRTAGVSHIRRTLKTITLVPLGAMAALEATTRQLQSALGAFGPVCLLTPRILREAGAPALPAVPHQDLSPAMVDWLAVREDEHRFVVYVADPADPVFTDMALHNADLILLVGQSHETPAVPDWEARAFEGANAPVARRALLLCHGKGIETITGTAAWLQPRKVDFHLHAREGVPGDMERVARVLAGKAIGLVLGGGAARGFAHLGVYRALHEAGIAIDWLAGASIGAVMAAGLATVPEPAEAIARARKAFVEGKPFGDITVPIISFLRGRRMEQLINANLPGEIEDMPVPFFCVSSNLGNGSVQVHDHGSVPRALRASVSLPGIFPPAVVNGQLAVDGGILDNLPVDLMRARPVGRVIAVDLSSRKDYTVNYDSVPSPWRVLAGKLPLMRRHRVPSPVSLMLMAMSIGAIGSARAAGARADLLVRPSVGGFSFTDVKNFDRVVEAGYQAGRQAIEQHWPASMRRA